MCGYSKLGIPIRLQQQILQLTTTSTSTDGLIDNDNKLFSYDNVMILAAGVGSQAIVNKMLLLGVTDYSSAFDSAAEGCYPDIFKQMLELMSDDRRHDYDRFLDWYGAFDDKIEVAAQSGYCGVC